MPMTPAESYLFWVALLLLAFPVGLGLTMLVDGVAGFLAAGVEPAVWVDDAPVEAVTYNGRNEEGE